MLFDSEAKEHRKKEHGVDDLFIGRWSPRAFSDEKLDHKTVMTLLEAARWAPSSYNEQPWRIIFAASEKDRKIFSECLMEGNRGWASKAPLLVCIAGKKLSDVTGGLNNKYAFDCGAAALSIDLQARMLGLYTHSMGGFDAKTTAKLLEIPDGFEPIVFVAVGKHGNKKDLPQMLQERENPSQRKKLDEIAFEGKFKE